jgi:hypothetical protein
MSWRRALLAVLLVAAPALAMPPSPPDAPLFAAVDKGDLKQVKKLVKGGADVYGRDHAGRTALVHAAMHGNAAMTSYLLGLKPDVDARDLYGNCALNSAAAQGDDKAAKALLAAGANPRLYNRRCQSPAELAAGFGRGAVFKTVTAAAASVPLPGDGTTEECALDAKARMPTEAQAYTRFHSGQLSLQSIDDYEAAAQSLAYLGQHPAQSKALTPALIALISAPMPASALDYPEIDRGVREAAVQALARIATTKAERTAVATALVKVVEKGGCSAFKPRACMAAKLKQCRARDEAVWPRDEEADSCFNCLHCEDATIGHGFAAALGWFKIDREHRALATKALDRLKDKHLLPRQEHQLLSAKLLPR